MYHESLIPTVQGTRSHVPGSPRVFERATTRYLLTCSHSGFIERVAATTLDGIFAALVVNIFSHILLLSPAAHFPLLTSLFELAIQLTVVVVEVYLVARCGGSVGKLILGMRIIDSHSGHFLSFWTAFIRETIGKMISFGLLFIGVLMVIWRRDKAALHDLMAGSSVRDIQEGGW